MEAESGGRERSCWIVATEVLNFLLGIQNRQESDQPPPKKNPFTPTLPSSLLSHAVLNSESHTWKKDREASAKEEEEGGGGEEEATY